MNDETEKTPKYREATYIPVDWNTQCEAKCRKTGKRCPHRCRSQIPSTLAAHNVCDGKQFQISGRPVHLCDSHSRSFDIRAKRLLSLPLIEGGHLSPYNRHGFGSVVIRQDRIDFTAGAKATIPKAWGVIDCSGYVPEDLLARLPKLAAFAALRKEEQ